MAGGQINGVLGQIRRLALTADAAELSDGQLLERFLAGREETAFEAVVRRHGPMVLGVCYRVLSDPHMAEDAFQATFLVLVRKARSIARKDQLAGWLYGVAYRTAQKARCLFARHRAREKQVDAMPEKETSAEPAWRDLQPLLDEELGRLPEKYRLLVVLCDLEGRPRADVARQLACPEGTLSSRLCRARQLLASRLTQRGVALSAAGLAAVLTPQTASAALPCTLVTATVEAAVAFAAGPAALGVVSAQVST